MKSFSILTLSVAGVLALPAPKPEAEAEPQRPGLGQLAVGATVLGGLAKAVTGSSTPAQANNPYPWNNPATGGGPAPGPVIPNLPPLPLTDRPQPISWTPLAAQPTPNSAVPLASLPPIATAPIPGSRNAPLPPLPEPAPAAPPAPLLSPGALSPALPPALSPVPASNAPPVPDAANLLPPRPPLAGTPQPTWASSSSQPQPNAWQPQSDTSRPPAPRQPLAPLDGGRAPLPGIGNSGSGPGQPTWAPLSPRPDLGPLPANPAPRGGDTGLASTLSTLIPLVGTVAGLTGIGSDPAPRSGPSSSGWGAPSAGWGGAPSSSGWGAPSSSGWGGPGRGASNGWGGRPSGWGGNGWW